MDFPGDCLGRIRQVAPQSCRGWGVGCLHHYGVSQILFYPRAKLYPVYHIESIGRGARSKWSETRRYVVGVNGLGGDRGPECHTEDLGRRSHIREWGSLFQTWIRGEGAKSFCTWIRGRRISDLVLLYCQHYTTISYVSLGQNNFTC